MTATVRLSDRTLTADTVVLATAHDVAAHLLPPGALTPGVDPRQLGTSPVVDVHLVLDRRVTDLAFAAVVDSPVQFVFDRTEPAGATSGQVQPSPSRPPRVTWRPGEVLVEQMVGARRGVPASGRPPCSTWSPRSGPPPSGRARQRAHRPGTRRDRWSTRPAWTATGWPATMEGAVRSGWAAAVALTADHRRPGAEGAVA
jgi:hypothetical protein